MPTILIIGIIAVCVGFALLHRQRSIHNERIILEHRFQEIQTRLACVNSLTVVLDIRQLVEIALQHYPGRGSALTFENYPFFERTTNILALMIVMDAEEKVFRTLMVAFEDMILHSSNSQKSILFHYLTPKLIEAKNRAENELITAMAIYSSYQPDTDAQKIAEKVYKMIASDSSKMKREVEEKSSWQEIIAQLCKSENFDREVKQWNQIWAGMNNEKRQKWSNAKILLDTQKAVDLYVATTRLTQYIRYCIQPIDMNELQDFRF